MARKSGQQGGRASRGREGGKSSARQERDEQGRFEGQRGTSGGRRSDNLRS